MISLIDTLDMATRPWGSFGSILYVCSGSRAWDNWDVDCRESNPRQVTWELAIEGTNQVILLNGGWTSRADVKSRLDIILCIQHKPNAGKRKKERRVDRWVSKIEVFSIPKVSYYFCMASRNFEAPRYSRSTWSWSTSVGAFRHAQLAFRYEDHDCKRFMHSALHKGKKSKKQWSLGTKNLRNVVPQGSPLPVAVKVGEPLRFQIGLNRSSLNLP